MKTDTFRPKRIEERLVKIREIFETKRLTLQVKYCQLISNIQSILDKLQQDSKEPMQATFAGTTVHIEQQNYLDTEDFYICTADYTLFFKKNNKTIALYESFGKGDAGFMLAHAQGRQTLKRCQNSYGKRQRSLESFVKDHLRLDPKTVCHVATKKNKLLETYRP